MILKIGADWM